MDFGTVVVVSDGVSINGTAVGGLRGRVVDMAPGQLRFVRFPVDSTRAEFFAWIRTTNLKVVS